MCDPGAMYKRMVPTNARMFIRGVAGEQSPIDETYFQPEDLESLRKWVSVVEAQKAKQDPLIQAYNAKPRRMSFRAGPDQVLEEYLPDPEPLTRRAVTRGTYAYQENPDLVSDEDYRRANTTLGQFDYDINPGGDVIAKDHYDFNEKAAPWGRDIAAAAVESLKQMSPYPLARTVGQIMVPDDGKHGYPIRLNLGNPKSWQK